MRKKLVRILKNPLILIPYFGSKGLMKWMPDELYLKLIYRAITGQKLNINHPKTYNEKLQWLKLNDKNPIYPSLVDKLQFRSFIEGEFGDEYLIPMLGVWNSFDEIDFEALPNQFVLKCTHDSGGHIICSDKQTLDIEKTRQRINFFLKRNFYNVWREWPYKDLEPRIICEEYMAINPHDGLNDYRFFCFDGEPYFIAVDFNITDKSKTRRNLFDLHWNLLEAEISYPKELPNPIQKPKKLDQMISLAKALSKSLPHVRVDFYYIEEQIYIGELTFYHQSGFGKFIPEEFNLILGGLIKLPSIKHE